MKFAYSPLSFAILATLNANSFAEQAIETQNVESSLKLQTIVVHANNTNNIGQTTYGKVDLEKTPNSSKNITDLLKVNPNVQFNAASKSGNQQGELDPADISINGGLSYDNKFLINGLSINNNINPNSSAATNSHSDLRGDSQSVAINTDLICDLTVLDSNVSAEYGEFMGGIVTANTCAPKTLKGELHGSVSYDYTSHDWSRINYVNDAERLKFSQSTNELVQPSFTKQGLSATLYGKVSDTLNFSVAAAQRWSKIPLKTDLSDVEVHNQTRQSNNFSFESFYTPSNQTQFKFGAQYFESDNNYYQNNVRNSRSNHISNSKNFYFQAKNDFKHIKFEQQFNYQTLNSYKTTANHFYSWLVSETKNWNASSNAITLAQEGSFGSMMQQEEKLEYNLKALFKPFKFEHSTHHVKAGTGYGHYSAYWERPNDAIWYISNGSSNLNGASCTSTYGQRYEACDEGITYANTYQGQYARTRTVYGAGRIEVSQDRWHAYVEDQFKVGQHIQGSLGLRNDYDSLSKQNKLSPRSSFYFSPFANQGLKISTGWNRYYGLNTYANVLQAKKRILQSTETRTQVDGNWTELAGSRYAAMGIASKIESAYSDELLFALSGQQANIDWSLKWVNRDNKKQVRRTKTETLNKPNSSGTYPVYTYDNSGTSTADIYTLSIRNRIPVHFKNTSHQWGLSVSYSDVVRNFESYDDSYEDPNELVYYDRELIPSADRPANNFNQPWTYRAHWDMNFDNIPLRLSHFFSLTTSYDKMLLKENDYKYGDHYYDRYSPTKNPTSFNWDMKASYEIPIAHHLKSIIGLTINNVTNKNNAYIDDLGIMHSALGRQFIADVTFKF